METYVVVIDQEGMGHGDSELGQVLMKAFLSALEESEQLPKEVLLYNTGVRLVGKGASTVEAFKALADRGVAIKACGTCLSYFQMEDELAVGEPSNMRYILNQLQTAPRIVRP